jgi:O-antigen/teichoic acid export membrane protein
MKVNAARRHGASLGLRVITVAALALSTAVAARRLNPTDFETFVVATSVALFGTIATTMGITKWLLREYAAADDDGDRDRLIHAVSASLSALWVTLPLGALGAAVAALSAVLGGLVLATDLARGAGRATLADLTAGRSGGLLATGAFLILLAAAPGPLSATGALALQAGGGALALAATLPVLGRLLSSAATMRSSQRLARVAISGGVVFAGSQALMLIASQGDLWIGAAVLDQTGGYGAAKRFLLLIALPLQTAQLVSQRRIAVLAARRDRDGLQAHTARAAALVAAPGLAALLVVFAFPGQALDLAFGPEYATVDPTIVRLLAAAQGMNLVTGLCGVALSMSGHERSVLLSSGFATLFLVVAGPVAAENVGATGLATVTAASTLLMFGSLWLGARRRLGIWTDPLLGMLALRRARLTPQPSGPSGQLISHRTKARSPSCSAARARSARHTDSEPNR